MSVEFWQSRLIVLQSLSNFMRLALSPPTITAANDQIASCNVASFFSRNDAFDGDCILHNTSQARPYSSLHKIWNPEVEPDMVEMSFHHSSHLSNERFHTPLALRNFPDVDKIMAGQADVNAPHADPAFVAVRLFRSFPLS
jgi:hypothetical protein